MKKCIICILVTLFVLVSFKSNSPVYGVDVSHHNTLTDKDWTHLIIKKNVKFVYIKASEGNHYKDSHRIKYFNKAKKLGLKVGFYHFFRDNVSADSQVSNFLNSINNISYDCRIALDYEKAGFHSNISELNRIKRLKEVYTILRSKGYNPIIYCNALDYFKIKPFIPNTSYWISSPNINLGDMSQSVEYINNKNIDLNIVYDYNKILLG